MVEFGVLGRPDFQSRGLDLKIRIEALKSD